MKKKYVVFSIGGENLRVEVRGEEEAALKGTMENTSRTLEVRFRERLNWRWMNAL